MLINAEYWWCQHDYGRVRCGVIKIVRVTMLCYTLIRKGQWLLNNGRLNLICCAEMFRGIV